MFFIGVCMQGVPRRTALVLCWRYYPKYSLLRKVALVWNLIAILVWPSGRDNRLPKSVYTKHCSSLGKIGLLPKHFILSHKYHEKSRLYSFGWLKDDGVAVFVKTTFDQLGAKELECERLALEYAKGKIQDISMPQLLATMHDGEASMLAQTLVPSNFTIVNKAMVPHPVALFESLREYKGFPGVDNDLSQYTWWSAFKRNASKEYFQLVNRHQQLETDFRICFAHGDLGSENIFYNEKIKSFWVIDWECWAPDAPYYADRLAYWLGQYNNTIRKHHGDVEKLTKLFYDKFIDAEKIPEEQALFALAFMVARNFNLAHKIALAVAMINQEMSG